ncbi:MAG: hypothetical protein E6Q36_09315 [Chryseobacterium sp.]|nr:MAG: hypothetical protein E6Q36_09315 [Chryseobacterium sp.]
MKIVKTILKQLNDIILLPYLLMVTLPILLIKILIDYLQTQHKKMRASNQEINKPTQKKTSLIKVMPKQYGHFKKYGL